MSGAGRGVVHSPVRPQSHRRRPPAGNGPAHQRTAPLLTIDPSVAANAADGASALTFASLGLSSELVRAVEKLGWLVPSAIQARAIPALLGGSDIVGQSQTGSGKTAAFCIPAIEKVDPASRATQVLILVPTRELATQVAAEAEKLACFKKGIRTVTVYGGASYDRQFADLGRGAQVVVGTPGRLVDLLGRKALDLSAIKVLVLDEADRMLDMGFSEDLEKLLAAAPEGRQTVFFSATFPPAIRGLVEHHARSPREVRVDKVRDTGPPAVDQVFHEVRHHAKSAALGRLIDFHDPRSGLVFCNTQRMVDELADWLLDRGCAAERLHGGMAQPQRTRVMEGFKRGAFRWLVATDVAARGIDVHDLALVVNYDLPIDAEDYVHRIGRTGRAGRNGMAVTLVSGGAGYRLGQIERALGVRIRREPVPSLKDVAAKRSAVVVDRVREALLAPGGPPPSGVVNALVEEGHSPEAIAAALVACYAPVPPADMPEEPLDAMPHRGPPGGPFGKVSGGKRPFAKRPYGKRPTTGAASPPRAAAVEQAADQAGPRHPKKTARTFGPVAGGGAEGGSRPPWAKKSFAKKKVWKKKKPGPG